MSVLGNRRLPLLSLVVLGAVLAGTQPVQAQRKPDLTRGFDLTLDPAATLAELNAQQDLWTLEVNFKPMRMIWVDMIDPRTGRKSRQLVWYLIYKAVNRPLPRREDTSDTTPQNVEDPLPTPLFVPEFTLVTNDNTGEKVYHDVVLPEAQAAILAREHRDGDRYRYKNPVEIVGELPQVTPKDAKTEDALYGIVTWRAVDPETDYFTVYMTGFSSAYKLADADGKVVPWRKTIVQEFWRPGDEFRQTEREILRKGDPQWIDRPDAPSLAAASPPAADDAPADDPPAPKLAPPARPANP